MDQSFKIFTKFDQNPTHSKQDISCKSGTFRHTDTHRDKVCRSLQSTDCDDKICCSDKLTLILLFQLTGRLEWSAPTLESIQQTCGTEVDTDSNQWTTSTNGDQELPPTIVSTLCPNQCNGNGQCIDSKRCFSFFCVISDLYDYFILCPVTYIWWKETLSVNCIKR